MISIAIPIHEMEEGSAFLTRSFDALWKQTFKNFEVIVTDNSNNDILKNICVTWEKHLDIKYYKNPKKGMAPNTNEAIKRSNGDLIKILYMDDYLAHENSLQVIENKFNESSYWLVTGCVHSRDGKIPDSPHLPKFSHQLSHGVNTIGSPSVLTISRHVTQLFDEKMTWLLDCDYYNRLGKIYGPPVILNDLNVVMGLGTHQATNLLSEELKDNEYDYLMSKHE